MKKISLVLSATLAILFAIPAADLGAVEGKATREECMAKCKEAAGMLKQIGRETALKKLNDKNGPFVWKDSYVLCIDIGTGAVLAHPMLPNVVGKMSQKFKDANGKLFAVEYILVAKSKGEGWISYVWPKPGEKKPSPKISYVYEVPGENVIMVAGIYE